MNRTVEQVEEIGSDPSTITPHELADMLDAGLTPVVIDRLRFTRWRLSAERDLDSAPEADVDQSHDAAEAEPHGQQQQH